MIDRRIKEYGLYFSSWTFRRIIEIRADSAVFEIERTTAGLTEKSAVKAVAVIEEDAFDESREGSVEPWQERKDRAAAAKLEEVRIMMELGESGRIVRCLDHELREWESGGRRGCDLLIREELLKPASSLWQHGSPDPARLHKLATDIAEALKVCHDAGIYHRDIKPSNIFENGEGLFILGDFGSAVRSSPDPAPLAGTALYAPPELLNGTARRYEPNADIYMLGVSLYELASGHLPFENSRFPSGAFVEKKLAGERFPKVPGVSAGLYRVILGACGFSADTRFHSADELLLALNGGEKMPEELASLRRRTGSKENSANKWIAFIAALAVMSVLAVMILPPIVRNARQRNAEATEVPSAGYPAAASPVPADPIETKAAQGPAAEPDGETRPLSVTDMPTAVPSLVPMDELAMFDSKSFETYLKETGQIGENETYGSLCSILSLYIYGFTFDDKCGMSDLAKFKNLDTLEIGDCSEFDFDWIRDLKSISAMELSQTPLKNFGNMPEFSKMTYLLLRDAGITNLDFVEKMPMLEFLDLGENDLADMDGLRYLTHLKTLSIPHNRVSDLAPIAACESISCLLIDDNPVGSIEALSVMPNLTELRCDSCDLSAIGLGENCLSRIDTLSAEDNHIRNINVLRSAGNLKRLFIANNSISDISVLFELPLLMQCSLIGNPVDPAEADALERILDERFAQDDTIYP